MSTKRVLIVDDNPDNRKLLFFALRMGGYWIDQTETYQEAKDSIESTCYDIALLDIELPDGNGLDLAQLLRDEQPNAMIVMLSARDDYELLERARSMLVSAYAVKPFNLPEILSFIQKNNLETKEMLVI